MSAEGSDAFCLYWFTKYPKVIMQGVTKLGFPVPQSSIELLVFLFHLLIPVLISIIAAIIIAIIIIIIFIVIVVIVIANIILIRSVCCLRRWDCFRPFLSRH
jgi:hypothetical protein